MSIDDLADRTDPPSNVASLRALIRTQWGELYPNQARPYPFVEQDVDQAVEWLQRFIDEIDR